MKQPDRITKLVDQCVDADICVWTNAERLAIVTLLRREQAYQRARVRRIVMKYVVDNPTNNYSAGYNYALENILKAMKGKP